MATERSDHISQDSLHDGQDTCQRRRDDRKAQHASTQTDTRLQGYIPRLSKVNMFTLLSLWMESFPKDESEADRGDGNEAVHRTGVVVVKDGRVVGLHCSGPELHAGQVAIVSHGGGRLSECQLYFSRRPCATCLKLIINAGVSQITFWPGDPEVSLLRSVSTVDRSQHCTSHDAPGGGDRVTQEAALDAVATERLKSISRPNICFLLEPLAPGLTQFIDDTSRGSDFMERVSRDDPGVEAPELFSGQRRKHLEGLSRDFLVGTEHQHRGVLTHMGLENFCLEPWFTSLRQNMRELLGVLASVAAGVPLMLQHGFYSSEEQQPPTAAEPPPPQSSPTVASCSTSPHQGVSQEVARHCIVQARLLSYQTEDPKAGVGAVIWAKGRGTGGGTGQLYLLGCGYNAYPVGSPYAEYRQLDIKQQQQQQQERQKHKYRYSIHAEQNALTFRTGEIRAWEPTMMFVTKCPCDECVPLIRAAGITHIYTTDQDSGKDKGDISYLRFGGLKGVRKFVWQKKKKGSSSSPDLADGLAWKHDGVQAEEEKLCNKKRCQDTTQDTPPVCN